MLKSQIFYSILILSFIAQAAVFAATKVERKSVTIPAKIQNLLNKNYAGWRVSRVSKDVENFYSRKSQKPPAQTFRGDFDGNGLMDYAVNIYNHRSNQEYMQSLLVFLAQPNGRFKEHQLETNPSDLARIGVFISPLRKGNRGFDYEQNRRFRFKNDAVGVNYFEKSSLAYVYKNGRFERVLMSD